MSHIKAQFHHDHRQSDWYVINLSIYRGMLGLFIGLIVQTDFALVKILGICTIYLVLIAYIKPYSMMKYNVMAGYSAVGVCVVCCLGIIVNYKKAEA